MSRKVSQARINKITGELKFWWNKIQNYLQMMGGFDIKEFLRDNPSVSNVLTMLRLDGQWDMDEYFGRLAVVMPDIMERDDEFITQCFMAFEGFPNAITGGTAIVEELPEEIVEEVTKPTAKKTTKKKVVAKPPADKPKKKVVGQDPVKVLKGHKSVSAMLAVCDGDPQKVLDLFEKGAEQCGSPLKFAKALGISDGYFYTNRKRLKAMVSEPSVLKTQKKDQSSNSSQKPKAGKGLFADLQANATTKSIVDMLGHGKAAKFRQFFKALGGTEESVRVSIEEAYEDGRRPSAAAAFLVTKYSKKDAGFEIDHITLKRFAKVFGINKNFRGRGPTTSSSSSSAGVANGGIEGELASKLTSEDLDAQQVAGMTLLAEEHEVNSIQDLLSKISDDGLDSMGAAKTLAKNGVLPSDANHISFMKFKTKMAV